MITLCSLRLNASRKLDPLSRRKSFSLRHHHPHILEEARLDLFEHVLVVIKATPVKDCAALHPIEDDTVKMEVAMTL